MDKLLIVASEEGSRRYFTSLGFKKIHKALAEDRNLIPGAARLPTLCLTGTCLGSGPDKIAIMKARNLGIPCVSVVDHWSWYRKRFETGVDLLLPDVVILNDDIAVNEAVADGLPVERLVALGNPVLEEMSNRALKWQRDPISARNKLGLSLNNKLIIFVSESLAKDFPSHSTDYMGYDEFSVCQEIVRILKRNEELIIKLHPSEKDEKYDYLKRDRVSTLRHATAEELASLADVVIGMGSMLLLEMAMLREDIISFRPGSKNPFVGETMGATLKANSIAEVRSMIDIRRHVDSMYKKKFIGSRNRIKSFLSNLLK